MLIVFFFPCDAFWIQLPLVYVGKYLVYKIVNQWLYRVQQERQINFQAIHQSIASKVSEVLNFKVILFQNMLSCHIKLCSMTQYGKIKYKNSELMLNFNCT